MIPFRSISLFGAATRYPTMGEVNLVSRYKRVPENDAWSRELATPPQVLQHPQIALVPSLPPPFLFHDVPALHRLHRVEHLPACGASSAIASGPVTRQTTE